MSQHTITYHHPETDEQYTVYYSVQLPVKYPVDPFARFQEPDDDHVLTIDSIQDCNGKDIPENHFEKWVICDIIDHCSLDVSGL